MDTVLFFIYLAVMAGVTYLIRAIPFVLCKGEVKNVFIRSFLTYVPYAVLGAMTFPAILFSTNGLVSAIAGTIVALVLAFAKKGLLTVAVGASAAAFIVKMAEMPTVVLQQKDKGATWMFEDLYQRMTNIKKIEYTNDNMEEQVDAGIKWAFDYLTQFGIYQKNTIPWLK